MNEIKQQWTKFSTRLNSIWHEQALWLFLLLVLGHFSEHVVQIYQIYIMGWLPSEAGGILGLKFPFLVTSEYLHIFYNGFTWLGVMLLRHGLKGQARTWWNVTILFASWHLFEHILLQYQYMTGDFWFGRTVQTGIGQLWFPRPELHFVYNLLVFTPMMLAYAYHFYSTTQKQIPVLGKRQIAA
ncbi:MAG: hypothetical protein AAF614_30165 [Chloroflexota bacterium]